MLAQLMVERLQVQFQLVSLLVVQSHEKFPWSKEFVCCITHMKLQKLILVAVVIVECIRYHAKSPSVGVCGFDNNKGKTSNVCSDLWIND